jgi:hypothetical protein
MLLEISPALIQDRPVDIKYNHSEMKSEGTIFKIGGIGLGLFGHPISDFSQLGRFPDFISSSSAEGIYQIKFTLPSGRPEGSLVFDSGQAWRLYKNRERRILFVGTRDFIPRFIGNFSSDYLQGKIHVAKSNTDPDKYIFPLSYPVGSLLMTSLLGTGYGIMLHACGVIDGDEGIVFAGTGSAGKTTTAHLWNNNSGVRVINDDHTIIRKVEDHFRVYGTPWHGQGGFAQAENAPLKKIFIIRHAQSNQSKRLSPAKAAADLLVRCFAPLWDNKAMAFTLQFMDELCQSIPCYELGFVPDQTSVEYVKCLS